MEIGDPTLVYLLIILGLVGIGVEALTPGGFIPAVLGIIALVVGVIGLIDIGPTAIGLGLLLLAVSGIATALAWRGAVRSGLWAGPTWAATPLAVGAALVLPQFFLPPTGRMAFGIAYAAAAALLAVTAQWAGSRGGAGAPFVPAVEVRA